MNKAEIYNYTKIARYWLSIIDKITRQPGLLDSCTDREKFRLLRAATEAAGNVGMLKTIFESEWPGINRKVRKRYDSW